MAYQPDENAADFLLSEAAQPYLEQAAAFSLDPAHSLANLARLRVNLPPPLAAAVLEQATLRQKAATKFDRAAQMLFTSDALQQTSGQLPARHRARRFAGLHVADLTCGIGGDALAIAEFAMQTIAIERDAVRLRFARHNLAAYGMSAIYIQADALQPPFYISRVDAIFADPGRRIASGRVFNPRDYQPPLDALYEIYGSRNLAIKVAPGIDYAALDWPAEVEIVSVYGEVKEAVLWTGELANYTPPPLGEVGRGSELRFTHPLPASPGGGGVIPLPLGGVRGGSELRFTHPLPASPGGGGVWMGVAGDGSELRFTHPLPASPGGGGVWTGVAGDGSELRFTHPHPASPGGGGVWMGVAGDGSESRFTHTHPATPGGGGVSVLRRATLLPAGDTITNADAPDECAVAPAGRYLYEPDGAVIRAGLVRNLAAILGLWQLDPQIAYLSSDAPVGSPFARRFTVEQAAPFSLKALTARLRELGVGITEIKKRGLDIDPDALRLRLKLHGPNSRTVILTRIGSQPMMYICFAS